MSHPRGKRLLVFAIASVLTAVACHDEEVVGPRMKFPHVLYDSRNKPFGEFDLQIPSDNSWPSYGALALTSTSINLPANQWVVLTVTGGVELQISSLCSNYPDCPATATHAGQTIDALGLYPSILKVSLSGAGYANIPLYYDDQNVPTALVWSGSGGVLSASRSGIQDGVGCYSPWPAPGTGITGCPPPNGTDIWFFANAYTMAGSQSLTAALVDPLVVHGTPTTIHPGDSVTFTANLVASIYKNGNTWTWVAGEVGNEQQDDITTDPPSGGVLVGCNASPCVYAPSQSGRMYVQSTDYYGHPMRGSSEYIAINSGKFRVTADPSYVTSGGIMASRVRASIRASESGSGSTVTFQASTDDQSSLAIQSWSYQPDSSTQGASSPCSPADNPCVTDVEQSGTMFVTATIDGKQELASAHVTVGPCPTTGDSVLDSPGVIDSLKAALLRSHPEATPGTGMMTELGGVVWRRRNGTFFLTSLTPLSTTECGITLPGAPYVPPPSETGSTVIANWHTHPSHDSTDVYGCPPNNGVVRAQHLGDGHPVPLAAPRSNGGGSDDDWDGTDANAAPNYVIDSDGDIWRLDPGTAPSDRKNNSNHWTWNHDSAGCAVRVIP